MGWQTERIQGFREKLKAEGIFPGCLGCCQSEYIGPSPLMTEVVEKNSATKVKFLKVRESNCSVPTFNRERPQV